MVKILVTLAFTEPGNPNFAMTTNVLEFTTHADGDKAYEKLMASYPMNAVYATIVKLY